MKEYKCPTCGKTMAKTDVLYKTLTIYTCECGAFFNGDYLSGFWDGIEFAKTPHLAAKEWIMRVDTGTTGGDWSAISHPIKGKAVETKPLDPMRTQ